MTPIQKLFELDKVSVAIKTYQIMAHEASIKIEQETGQSKMKFWEYWDRASKYRTVFAKLIEQCEANGVDYFEYVRAQFARWPVKTFNPKAKNPIPPFPTPVNLLTDNAWKRYNKYKSGRPAVNCQTDAYKRRQGQLTIERLMKVHPAKYPTVESVLANPDVMNFLPEVFKRELGL